MHFSQSKNARLLNFLKGSIIGESIGKPNLGFDSYQVGYFSTCVGIVDVDTAAATVVVVVDTGVVGATQVNLTYT